MDANVDDKWMTRQEVADRHGMPVKTLAQCASQGNGPRYAKFGKHVRYLLGGVIAWERKRFDKHNRNSL